jgi:hypothetical protein
MERGLMELRDTIEIVDKMDLEPGHRLTAAEASAILNLLSAAVAFRNILDALANNLPND